MAIGAKLLFFVFYKIKKAFSFVNIAEHFIPADESSFEDMYTTHFRGMYRYACTILNNEAQAEEMVQSVFVKLWEKKGVLRINSSLKCYLYRVVHNDCMNMLKHNTVKVKFIKEKIYAMQNENENAGEKMQASELEEKYRSALRLLPEQCRTIFQLSRFEDMKYREIAQHLGIAEKTVENQMGKALKFLRLRLAEFLVIIITVINILKN